MDRHLHSQVIVVGAGAAGLACAQALHEAGISYLLFEAKDHIGGRALTRVLPSNLPVELGAEFIHGAHPEILDLCQKNQIPFHSLTDHHLLRQGDSFVEKDDFWDLIGKINSHLRKTGKNDRSIAEFLSTHQKSFSAEDIALYRAYIEGFQAADPQWMSEHVLAAANEEEEPELQGLSQFRPTFGYAPIIDSLLEQREHLYLGTALTELNWNQDKVHCLFRTTEADTISATADFVVLAVPLGVLQASLHGEGFTIAPTIPALEEAAYQFSMGHVCKIVFSFHERFWESLSEKTISFLHSGPEHYFPTWWTQAPLRTSLLTAWQGGPKANDMRSWNEEQKVETALRTLAFITKHKMPFLRRQLDTYFTHDWTNDHFSLGAYSYPLVDCKPEKIRQIFEDKILIAGEATAKGSAQGTIHGAIQSGQRAARQIHQLLTTAAPRIVESTFKIDLLPP